MIIHENIIQGSEEWHTGRDTRPTGSEYSKIYTGGGKISSQRENYMRRLSVASKYKLPKFQGNKWTDRGTELEPEARDKFVELTGLNVREVGFVEHDNKVTGMSPDGFIYSSTNDPVNKPLAGVEIKCFNLDKHLGIVHSDRIPTDMKPQVHGGMFVSGLPIWVCVFYCPEAYPQDIHIIEVEKDYYTEDLGGAILDFCEEYKNQWQTFLAEYEVDIVNKNHMDKMPILKSLLSKEETF